MPPHPIPPELRNLSEQDVEFVDEVMRRAGPSTASFDGIYAAYTGLLKERNMDAKEARIFKKLLKVGNMKGKNWGDKWEFVKSSIGSRTDDTPSTIARSEISSRLTVADEDTPIPKRFSKPSRLAKQDSMSSVLDTPPPRFPPKSRTTTKTSESLQKLNRLVNQRTSASIPAFSTLLSVDDDSSTTAPPLPSYKSTYQAETQIPTPPKEPMPLPGRKRVPQINAIAKHALGQPSKPRRMSNVDVDEVWKNIEMENNEKHADEYYDSRILARYFNVWKEGARWVRDTLIQVDDARDKMLQQQAFERWTSRLQRLRTKEDGIIKEFNRKILTAMLAKWQSKYKQRRQLAWRQDMRQKLTTIRAQLDTKLKAESLAKWHQACMSRQADRHYLGTLLSRSIDQWRSRYSRVRSLEARAEEFMCRKEDLIVVSAWNTWKGQLTMRWHENDIARKVNRRLCAHMMQQWKRRLDESRVADQFAQFRMKKSALLFWKERLQRVRDLDVKAAEFARGQGVHQLQKAVRIWRVSMRGKKLEKYRQSRIQAKAWNTLLQRFGHQQEQMDKAIAFQARGSSSAAVVAVQRWKRVLETHRNAAVFADQYRDRQLQIRYLLAWRLRLRDSHQSMKIARWANRFFTTRAAWRLWLDRMADRAREKRLQTFQKEQAKRYLLVWHARTKEKRVIRFFEEQRDQRLVRGLLNKWMNRVIEIKVRELDVAQQYDMTLQATAFQRWHSRRQRNLELQKLLESQLLVRQEGLLRHTFRRWLTATRSVEQRRQAYEQKEEQMRQMIITAAWEKWRERFKEERLRPLEYEVIIRQQRGVMVRALYLWQRKTLTLPAVRFDTKRLKSKYLKIWKDALPLAQQHTKAREMNRLSVLRLAMGRWKSAYQTKTTLKFVERAKNLRSTALNRPLKPLTSRPLSLGPRGRFRQPVVESTDDDTTSVDESKLVVPSRPLTSRPPFRLPRHHNISPPRDTISQARQTSPVRSVASYAGRRRSRSPAPSRAPSVVSAASDGDRLWSALKGLPPRRR